MNTLPYEQNNRTSDRVELTIHTADTPTASIMGQKYFTLMIPMFVVLLLLLSLVRGLSVTHETYSLQHV